MGRTGLLVLALMAAGCSGCQSVPHDGPARLASGEPAALEALRAALATATASPRLALGQGDPAGTGSLAVLPPPPGLYETRSTAMPVLYDLAIRDGACVAVQRSNRAVHPLPGVVCVPVPGPDPGR